MAKLSDEIARRAGANAAAARSILEAAGLAVEVVDATQWRVANFAFWPASGLWRRPDGGYGGGGARPLVHAIRVANRDDPSTAA